MTFGRSGTQSRVAECPNVTSCGCRASVEQSAATDQGRLLNTDILTKDLSPIFSVSRLADRNLAPFPAD